jgi:hypothetical protein
MSAGESEILPQQIDEKQVWLDVPLDGAAIDFDGDVRHDVLRNSVTVEGAKEPGDCPNRASRAMLLSPPL